MSKFETCANCGAAAGKCSCDLDMMLNPKRWPDIYLHVKRRPGEYKRHAFRRSKMGSTLPETGIIYAPLATDIPIPVVHRTTQYVPDVEREMLDYSSIESILDDGWIVD